MRATSPIVLATILIVSEVQSVPVVEPVTSAKDPARLGAVIDIAEPALNAPTMPVRTDITIPVAMVWSIVLG